MKTTTQDNRGFTLVELAIVMIIIGLLIGGVLKGQQLVDNAKVTATLSQIRNYQAAINSFRDTYGAMPGDMRNALTRLSGCTAANNCANGNGDGFVQLGNGLTPAFGAITPGGDESVYFWKHLALADLIVGVDYTSGTTAADLDWGITHPESSLRGGFEVYYDTSFADVGPSRSGLLLRLSNTGLGNAGGVIGTTGVEPLTATMASNLDLKLDDGRPSDGIVFVNNNCKIGDVIGGAYDEQDDQRSCVLYFVLDS